MWNFQALRNLVGYRQYLICVPAAAYCPFVSATYTDDYVLHEVKERLLDVRPFTTLGGAGASSTLCAAIHVADCT